MKNISLFVFAVFTFLSCSSTKEIASQGAETNKISSVKSYGTQGRIVYPEDIDDSRLTNIKDETEERAEVEVPKIKIATTSDEASGSAQQRTKKSTERTRQAGRAIQSKRTQSEDDWEPYRDPNRVADKKKNGFAIAGFVLSLIAYFFPIAIVFSAIGLNSEKRGLALAGLIISCLWGALIIAALIYTFLY